MMTKREAVLLASRALSLYLLCWGLNDLSYVAQPLFSLVHHSRVAASRDYLWGYYVVDLAFHAIRIIALFATAGWLYKCSPRVEGFFLPSEAPNIARSEGT